MVDILLLVTKITSLIAFILLSVAIVISLISFLKFTGDGRFKRSILFLILYLLFFLLAVGVMSLYHWFDSDLMEKLWYVMLNISLLFGIISGLFSISFYKSINIKK